MFRWLDRRGAGLSRGGILIGGGAESGVAQDFADLRSRDEDGVVVDESAAGNKPDGGDSRQALEGGTGGRFFGR